MKAQADAIFDHLKSKGSITALEALDSLGVFRLAARVKDLRDRGYAIRTTMVELPSGKRIARYTYHASRTVI